jgi:hypothetical protein
MPGTRLFSTRLASKPIKADQSTTAHLWGHRYWSGAAQHVGDGLTDLHRWNVFLNEVEGSRDIKSF